MFSAKKTRIFNTVRFHLTFWYTVIFAVLSFTAVFLVYTTLKSNQIRSIDEDLIEETAESDSLYSTEGISGLKEQFEIEEEAHGADNIFFLFLSPQLEIMNSSNLSHWKGVEFAPSELLGLQHGSVMKRTVYSPDFNRRGRAVYRRIKDDNIIGIARTLENEEEKLASYRSIFMITGISMLICGSILGWWIARRAMSGVERVTQTAISIGKDNLADRVPVGREGREIRGLAMAFNGMLERIQALVTGITDMTDNVAHDLRSPITRMRGMAELALSGSYDRAEYEKMAGNVIEESDRLIEMIKTMLEIAETNSGVAKFHKRNISIKELVQEAYELFLPVSDAKGVTMKFHADEEPSVVYGDLVKIQRVISNLVDNAIKYTPSGGEVALSVESANGSVITSVSDSGIGINEKDLPRIFERFYRAEASRSTQGNGLGLSLAQSIVKAHGGEIHVESQPGKGSTFAVTLPRESTN